MRKKTSLTLLISIMLLSCEQQKSLISLWPAQEPNSVLVVDLKRSNFPAEYDWLGVPVVISTKMSDVLSYQVVIAISPYSGCKLRINKADEELISDCHADRYDFSGKFLGLGKSTVMPLEWKHGDLIKPAVVICSKTNELLIGSKAMCLND